MEEKNSLKKSIILVCAVAVLILIATISAFFMMDNKNEVEEVVGNTLNENSIPKQNVVNNEENVVEAVKDVEAVDVVEVVEIDMYKNVKGDDDVIITEANIIKDIENITDEKLEDIVKKTLTEYTEIARYEKSNIGPMPGIIDALGLGQTDENETYNYGNPQTYIKTNISYSKFKNALLQYVTEDYFIKYFSQYKNIDEKFACTYCAGGVLGIGVEEVEFKYKKDNKYVFDITYKDTEIYSFYELGENYTEEDYLFKDEAEFEYVNGRLVISKYSDQIFLDGVYTIDASDIAYKFFKNGDVEYSTNMMMYKGTYTMNGETELLIMWDEKVEWDDITLEETVTKIDGSEIVEVIDDNNITITNEIDGKTYSNDYVKFKS